VRQSVRPAARAYGAAAAAIALAVPGVAGCGGQGATTASPPPATRTAPPAATAAAGPPARCRAVPRATVRLIASRADRRTRFAARSAAAVRAGSGFAVSVVALAGGARRTATWFVDDLRVPRAVMSADVQALEITNWPLRATASGPVRASGICATRNVRGPGPLAP
jgi:hypothetical protein